MEILAWLKRLLRREHTSLPPFHVVTRQDGSKMMVDLATLDYLQSTAPDPTQASLDELFSSTTRVRLMEGGMAAGKALGTDVLLDIQSQLDMEVLHRRLRIVVDPETFGHCMCYGDQTFEFYAGPALSASIGLHHVQSIRWDAWKHDALLVDGPALADWLAARGVSGPQLERERQVKAARESHDALVRWRSAMPACLLPYADQVLEPMLSDVTPLVRALETAYADPREAAQALFWWFGHGQGPWNGFPSYEQVPEKLLETFPLETLFSALDVRRADEAHLEGASRYFAGWSFQREKSRRRRLPEQVKTALLEHCLKLRDADKIAQARKAFT